MPYACHRALLFGFSFVIDVHLYEYFKGEFDFIFIDVSYLGCK